jgi:hypothetical protein
VLTLPAKDSKLNGTSFQARTSWAIAIAWVFNVWGALDLLTAIYNGQIGVRISPGSLGAASIFQQFLWRRCSLRTG